MLVLPRQRTFILFPKLPVDYYLTTFFFAYFNVKFYIYSDIISLV